MSKRGHTIRSSGREIISNVIKECDEEAKNKAFKLHIGANTQRAALYCGVSEWTIRNIRKQSQIRNLQHPNEALKSPGKKRSRPTILEKVDDFDFQVIRRTVEEFYLELKQVPTLRKLLEKIKEKIEFPWGRTSLLKLLKANGFVWRKCQNKRKLLMERPANVHWRVKYLEAIKKYQTQNKNIVYIDETWIDNDMTVQKCWQSETHKVMGVTGGIRSTGRLIVVHAGSIDGFVQGSQLVFRAGLSTGDYHGQMNRTNFEKWLAEKLFPHILPGSVIVFDNAPYHSEQSDKFPTKYSTKQTITSWLQKHNIPHNPTARKVDLVEILTRHKPQEKSYKVDYMMKNHGFIPLRLPPYMCDLNPIELAWADVKRYVRERNTTGELTAKDLISLTYDAIASINDQHWKGYIKHVMDIENHYWEQDKLIESAIDEFIINFGENSDEEVSSRSSFSSSSDDNESSYNLSGVEELEFGSSAS